MGKVRKIALTAEQQSALEIGYRTGQGHAFRKRCHLVLLKYEGRTSLDVGLITGMNQLSVNSWLDRNESGGLTGLYTKAGRGRKPILDAKADKGCICRAVKEERQRLSQAKVLLEAELGKQFSGKTLRRFLKNLTAAASG